MPSQVLHLKTTIDVLCSDIPLFLVPPKVFGVFVMFIYIKGIGLNWTHKQKNVYFLDTLLLQWVIIPTTHGPEKDLSSWMSHF